MRENEREMKKQTTKKKHEPEWFEWYFEVPGTNCYR